MPSERGPVGIFVLRVWSDASDPAALRIRMVSTPDAAGGESRTQVVTSRDEACAALAAWLDEFASARSRRRVTGR
jgi:hypothetical protein